MTVKKHDNGKWYCKFTIRGVTKHLLCAGATTEKEALEIKDFRFHDLRHTFATRMVMAKVDFLTLMELLGHKNIQTTMRYAHVIPGRKMEAIKKLATYNN